MLLPPGMPHPKDQNGLTRGQLLRGAAAAAAGVGVAGGLVACENTTTPIGAGCEPGSDGGSGSPLVEAKPVGPAGLPLPRTDNSITWSIVEDNQPIADDLPPETGATLRLFNYADYLWPRLMRRFEDRYDCTVELATYNSADEAIAKLQSGVVDYDVIVGLSGNHIVSMMALQLLQPLNHTYLPNLAANIWPQLADPFYDRGSRYTVPYVTWCDGIGWRNDRISVDIPEMDVPWDIFWQSEQWRGKVGLLDDKRDGLSMPMQRDSLTDGTIPDLNTEDPEIVAKAGQDLEQLTEICNIKVTITDYQTLPEGTTFLHHSWSGDLLAGAFYYMPSGVSPEVLSFWWPEVNGVVQNDFLAVTRAAESPVLAHLFLDYLMGETVAYENFVNFNGYLPPQNGIDADSLIAEGVIPETLAKAVVSPEQFLANQELLQLTVEGERYWDQAWSQFRAG
jgi:spermidine/putrescine transport system substrate-binding protein